MIPEDQLIKIPFFFPRLFGRKSRRGLLSERPQLSPDEFHDMYYSDQDIHREVIKIIYDLAERNFGFPLHGIQPDDRWVEDIHGNQELDTLELWGFVEDLEHEFGIQISDEELRDLKTVDDLVVYLDQQFNSDEYDRTYCPECRTDRSNNADRCPSCGCPYDEDSLDRENNKRMERYIDKEYYVELSILMGMLFFDVWFLVFSQKPDTYLGGLFFFTLFIIIYHVFVLIITTITDWIGGEIK